MACSKYILTNTGSSIVNFSYQRCDDAMWEYQVELNPNQTKNIWLLNTTYSSAFSNSIVLVDLGVFPPVVLTPTPTISVTPSNTPTISVTPSITASQTQTPTQTASQTQTQTQTPTPSITASQTQTSTPTQTGTAAVTPTQTASQTPTQTQTSTPTQTGTAAVTPTPSVTTSQTPTNTPTPTQVRFAFTIYSGTTSNEACGQYNSTSTIYGDKAIFDENTIFYNVLSGPTTVDMTGYYNNSQIVVELNSGGIPVGGLYSLCATLTPTPTQTKTPTNTPSNTATNTQTPTNTPSNTPTNTQTPSNTATNTQTPTNTPTPTPTFGYYTYSLGTGSTANLACADFSSAPNTIYGTVSGGIGPNVSEYLYFNTSLTTPVQNGYYSNGTDYYVVTGGLGQITSSDLNGCT